MKPVRPFNLRNQILTELMSEIAKMAPGENQLPSEEELAKQLDVSRATVREALSELTNNGHITRRQGKGNFGHPSAVRLNHRIDMDGDFFNLLGTPENPVRCEVVRMGYAPIPELMRKDFADYHGRAFEQYWLYGSLEKPMILCKNYVPEELLVMPPRAPEENQTMMNWILQYCNKDGAFYAVHMGCGANKEANWVLGIGENTVVQNWQETVYDIYDHPVAFCDIFFHPEHVDLSMVLW